MRRPPGERIELFGLGALDRQVMTEQHRHAATAQLEQRHVGRGPRGPPAAIELDQRVTVDQFGCDLLWDKSYSWDIEDDVPLLTVRMTDTYAESPQPWVELTFNGDSGELHATALNPHNLSPCGG